MRILPCPVCGKLPKITFLDECFAIAKCKPVFGRLHLIVSIGQNPTRFNDNRAEEVIKVWNQQATDRTEQAKRRQAENKM